MEVNHFDASRAFGAIDRLYGAGAYSRLAATHVAVIGVGGVGSWTVEALARCGVGELTLVDADHIAESNLNRQLPALTHTIGASKVSTLHTRISQINPLAQVHLVDDFVSIENAAQLISTRAHVVVDCIDAPAVKAAITALCRARKTSHVMCGAAGAKTDPTRIRVQDLSECTHDPLLAAVRSQLRRRYDFVKKGRMAVRCVSSDEPRTGAPAHVDAGAPLACAGYGSVVTVTATMGFAAASEAIALVLKGAC
jgi:tRNA threonylcarbamoyladenosine dehydratase